jgi:hypothetical protein
MRIVIIVEALFFGSLVVWLNTPRIRSYFVRTAGAADSELSEADDPPADHV